MASMAFWWSIIEIAEFPTPHQITVKSAQNLRRNFPVIRPLKTPSSWRLLATLRLGCGVPRRAEPNQSFLDFLETAHMSSGCHLPVLVDD